jgi:hypothetical protein
MHTDVSRPPEYARTTFFLTITNACHYHSRFMFFGLKLFYRQASRSYLTDFSGNHVVSSPLIVISLFFRPGKESIGTKMYLASIKY